MDVLFWAALVVMFVIIEIATVQLVSIWLAAGSFVTMICAYIFDLSTVQELLIFLISSAIFLAISWPLLKKARKKGYVSTNAELDVGKKAVVIENIDLNAGTGRVTLNGVDWSAVSADGSVIPKESVVTVVEVQGAKLKVQV
jgi:membrane protein implicated in regulation of membrane protease activity